MNRQPTAVHEVGEEMRPQVGLGSRGPGRDRIVEHRRAVKRNDADGFEQVQSVGDVEVEGTGGRPESLLEVGPRAPAPTLLAPLPDPERSLGEAGGVALPVAKYYDEPAEGDPCRRPD